jgi:phosphoglycerol transferase
MSGNRWLRMSLLRRNVLTAVVAGLLSLLLTFLVMHLWRFDLTVPAVYWSDALYVNVLVKALTEGTWNYHIARLGAPFGLDAVDFPYGCTLDLAIIKILTVITRNPFLSANLYWLLTITMAGVFAALFFRSLQIGYLASASFATLFAIIPGVFFRNISHLHSVQFIVPAAAYLGVELARGHVFGIAESNRPSTKPRTQRRIFLLSLAICAAIGLTFTYWGFFACIVIAIGSLIGWCRSGNRKIVLTALLYVVIIGTVSVAEKSASLLYWYRNGYNRTLWYKVPSEADTYALGIRQMLTPIPNHPLPLMRRIRDKIKAAQFPNDGNESFFAALGTIGVMGFLILICVAVGRPRGRILGDPRLRILSGFVVAVLLIAGAGGFGSLFNVFVVHEFRAYNRISPFVALFSLAAVAITVDAFLAGKKRYWQVLLCGSLLIFGAFDQISLVAFGNRKQERRRFYEDQFFIRELESRLPAATMVFQLPYEDFLYGGRRERMLPGDQMRPYLHSKTLRWSWGAMSGRHNNWTNVTAALPLDQFMERIVFAGFGGLLIDRYGYKDSKLEQSVLSYLGPANKFDLGGRWVFFDLRAFREKLESSLSSEERARREEIARLTPEKQFEAEFDASSENIFEAKTGVDLAKCRALQQCELRPSDNGLKIIAKGRDAAILLPNFVVRKRFMLRVTIDSSTETGIQLFYMMPGDKTYDERHAALYPLKKGKNVIYFKVDQDAVDPLRLDPSYTPGEYTIESIVARSIP